MNDTPLISPPPRPMMEKAKETKNPLRKLYYWTLHWAETKYALPALVIVSFVESSFFPIPPDVLLIAMCFGARKHWLKYAFWCSIASVLGGIFGWYIGYGLYESVGKKIIEALHYQDKFAIVEGFYQQNAFLYILAAAFTPIPYKVFTIAAGVFHDKVPLSTLILASVIGRSARFFLVALIIRIFGERARHFIEKNFEIATVVFLALAILGFLAIKLLK